MSSAAPIYTGPWINHSHNILLGATITLTSRDGAFLLAFLAVLVATAGTSFWTVVSYVAHQARSKDIPHDALFYQQQAVLKNTGSALGAAWKFAQVSFSWRKHERSKWWHFWRSRTVSLIAMALTLAVIFGIASIFSSQVTKAAGEEVLLHSPDCGFWQFGSATVAADTQWQLKSLNDSIAAANYARNCYDTNEPDSPFCNTYVVPEITWTTNQNSSCPFAPGACFPTSTAAYQMDTGYLDSHAVLGLDAKASERVSLRKVATCAQVRGRPYAVFVNQTVGGGSFVDEYIQLDMGPITGSGSNWTYEYNIHASFVNIGYDLQAQTSQAGMGSNWTPIPDFNRTDADVSMFFLAPNSVTYAFPNADPMFSATTEFNVTVGGFTDFYYVADDYITITGCTDQYQICNPNKPGLNGCTPLGPIYSLPDEGLRIGLNAYQYDTAGTIVIAMRESSMFYSVVGRGSSALKAQSTVFGLNQVARLPDNQWQIEVSGWFAVSLASLQQALVEKASGPTNIVSSGGYVESPSDKYQEAICKRQMIRNVSGYQNFSTLGVAIILIAGASLVLLGLVIDIVVGLVQERVLKRHYARLAWASDGYLQLQRLAYEGAGYDDWHGCSDTVPTLSSREERAQQLGGMDISDLYHPRLVQSAPNSASPSDHGQPEEGIQMVNVPEASDAPNN